eukprot:symbB.v1.2.009330.t1/scaffold588.1/size186386/7
MEDLGLRTPLEIRLEFGINYVVATGQGCLKILLESYRAKMMDWNGKILKPWRCMRAASVVGGGTSDGGFALDLADVRLPGSETSATALAFFNSAIFRKKEPIPSLHRPTGAWSFSKSRVAQESASEDFNATIGIIGEHTSMTCRLKAAT